MSCASRGLELLLAGAALALVAGCTLGPDFLRPDPPEVKGYTPEPLAEQTTSAATVGGAAQHFRVGQDIPGEWWTLFHSQPLNQLIEGALKASPDLAAVQAALRQARETARAGEGALYPSVSGSLQAQRAKESGASFGQPNFSSLYNLYNASVNVSYTIDVWGGTRRQIEALQAQTEYQRFQLEAAYLSLTANLATAAIQEASLRGQIDATEEVIRVEREQLDTVRRQFAIGGVSRADVLTQEATLAQSLATLPPLQKQLAQARNQVTALSGRLPSQDSGVTFDLASLQLPDELPVSLPSSLVRQRPDVRSYEALWHQASAQVGVATANQFPQFTLSASVGDVASKIGDVFGPGSGVWSLGAGVSQSIFDAGTLLHKKRAAEAALDEAAAQYRSTVITAFQNVADALRALQSDAETLRAQLAAERSAFASLDLSRQQYRVGAVSYLTLLTAQKTYSQALVSLAQAQAARYADTAALFQALGGGWWNRGDAAPGGDDTAPPDIQPAEAKPAEVEPSDANPEGAKASEARPPAAVAARG